MHFSLDFTEGVLNSGGYGKLGIVSKWITYIKKTRKYIEWQENLYGNKRDYFFDYQQRCMQDIVDGDQISWLYPLADVRLIHDVKPIINLYNINE